MSDEQREHIIRPQPTTTTLVAAQRRAERAERELTSYRLEVERLGGVVHECNRQIDQIVSERNDAEETVRAHESMKWPEEAHRLQQRLYEAKRQLSREEYRSDRLRDRLHEAEDRAARYEAEVARLRDELDKAEERATTWCNSMHSWRVLAIKSVTRLREREGKR